jgi:hypothetical protein
MTGSKSGATQQHIINNRATAGQVAMTPIRPKPPGDEGKANALVARAKATMERHED